MSIKGLTDQFTLSTSRQKPRIKVYCGTMKQNAGTYTTSGKDLETFFRIETGCDRTANALVRAYSSEDEQNHYRQIVANIADKVKGTIPLGENSVYLPKIDLYLPYSDRDKTFNTKRIKRSTKADDISGIIHECDNEKIYLEYGGYTDEFGHKRKKACQTNKPCPIAGDPYVDCPLGCQRHGELLMYLRGLFELGIQDTACLTITGFENLVFLSKYLYEVEQTRGDIKSAFGSVATGHFIPYQLTRKKVKIQRPILQSKKRTGKKTEDYTWAVSLNIDPQFLADELRDNMRQLETERITEVVNLGYSVEPKQIEAAYNVKVRRLKPTSEGKISQEQVNNLKVAYKKNNWDVESLTTLLRDRFNISDLSEIHNLNNSSYNKLYSLLTSKEALTKHQPF